MHFVARTMVLAAGVAALSGCYSASTQPYVTGAYAAPAYTPPIYAQTPVTSTGSPVVVVRRGGGPVAHVRHRLHELGVP